MEAPPLPFSELFGQSGADKFVFTDDMGQVVALALVDNELERLAVSFREIGGTEDVPGDGSKLSKLGLQQPVRVAENVVFAHSDI